MCDETRNFQGRTRIFYSSRASDLAIAIDYRVRRCVKRAIKKIGVMMERYKYSGLEIPFYPFLLAIAPLVSLYAFNSSTLGLLDVMRAALASFAIALLVLVSCWAVNRHWRAAALLTAIFLAGFLTYGAMAKTVYSAYGQGFVLSNLPVFYGALILGVMSLSVLSIRRKNPDLKKTTVVFNTFAIVLVFAATIPLFSSPEMPGPERNRQLVETRAQDHEWFSSDMQFDRQDFPDFYYLILDEYARADMLLTRFGFDNAEMIQWLQGQGFFIGHNSHSNYPWTHQSLASTFNAEYLHTLIPGEIRNNGTDSPRDRFLFVKKIVEDHFINTSKLLQFFGKLGYRVVANNSGHSLTRRRPETLRQAMSSPINEFEEELLNRSLAQPVYLGLRKLNAVKKQNLLGADKILGMLDDFAGAAEYEGPKFVISHILSPHTPFTFDKEGNGIPRHPLFDSSAWLSDRSKMPGYKEWYKENYPKNVAGLNVHLKRTLEDLLSSTSRDAVIIVQSDHGSALGMDEENVDKLDVEERFGILNAIYIPDRFTKRGFANSTSAVNTFPLVLNTVFGLSIPLRQDRAYYSGGDLTFKEITHRVRQD